MVKTDGKISDFTLKIVVKVASCSEMWIFGHYLT
jgi:hypothetical protein